MLIVAMGSLANLYSTFGFLLFNGIKGRHIFKRSAYENTTGSQIIASVFMGLALSVALLGVLFRVQMYPGADIMITVGTASSILMTIILSALSTDSIKRNAFRFIPILLLSICFSFISDDDMLENRYKNHPDILALKRHLREHPKDTEARLKLDSIQVQRFQSGYKKEK